MYVAPYALPNKELTFTAQELYAIGFGLHSVVDKLRDGVASSPRRKAFPQPDTVSVAWI